MIEAVILDMLTLIAVENAHLDILGRAVGKNAAVTAKITQPVIMSVGYAQTVVGMDTWERNVTALANMGFMVIIVPFLALQIVRRHVTTQMDFALVRQVGWDHFVTKSVCRDILEWLAGKVVVGIV